MSDSITKETWEERMEREEKHEEQIKTFALNTLRKCQEEGFTHKDLQRVLGWMGRHAKDSPLHFSQ